MNIKKIVSVNYELRLSRIELYKVIEALYYTLKYSKYADASMSSLYNELNEFVKGE